MSRADGIRLGEETQGTIVVDGGRTGLRLARIVDGAPMALIDGPGLPVISGPEGPAAVVESIAGRIEAAGVRPGEAPAIVAGLTGLFEDFEHASAVSKALIERLGLLRCTLTSDVVTSHLGALGGRPGVVAAVGTGTVVIAVGPDGTWAKTDGWGFLLGDAGSGFDIGRRALVAAMEYHDGRGGSAALAAAARERFGPLETLTARVHGAANPVALIASFTPDVVASARDGDEVAVRLWDDAVGAVTRAILGAANTVFPPGTDAEVSWAGSLMDLDDVLRTPVTTRLQETRPELTVVAPVGSGLDGAATLLDPRIHDRMSMLLHHDDTGPG